MYTTLTYFSLFFCCLFGNVLMAQKAAIKSVVHQKQTRDNLDKLTVSSQFKREYNTFGKMALNEYYSLDNNNKLQMDKQVRYSYDPQGRHQNTLQYDGDGLLNAETKLYWDEYNNRNKIEEISYTDGKRVAVAITYQLEYDEKGNKKAEKHFDNNGNEIQGKNWYYNNQNEVKRAFAWADDKKSPRSEVCTVYKRDDNGNLIRSVSKESVNGKIFRKDVRFFNNNYLIEWEKYINGKLESRFINEYRDSVIIRTTRHNKREVITLEESEREQDRLEKNTKKRNRKDEKEDIWVTNTEYDAYGNILVTSQSMNEVVFFVTQYTYDDYGNKIKTIEYNKAKDIKQEERLEYDEWGSISKKTSLLDDKIIQVDTYQYEYFEE